MKQLVSPFFQVGICAVGYFFATSSATLAQITPDGTVNTQVNQDGNSAVITGGETRGSSLFHSFQDFSVVTGNEAFFNNANSIDNIFSRVTGGNISNINGAIRANGSASLFLINPAGIIFGENARLDIGGSFYGSSASSILFEDGEFSAADLENPPLLTVNAPIGLGFRDNPGDIVNRSTVENSDGNIVGLEVLSGNSLILVGGEINFENGNITAQEGNIALGGLSQAGIVDLNSDDRLTFPENVTRSNINFIDLANADVRGSGGNISLTAQNLNLEGIESRGTFLTAGISGDSNSPEVRAGDISIDVAENIRLSNGQIVNQVVAGGIGNSGNITISTGNLEMVNGGVLFSSTAGTGNAGNIDINATDSITVDGENTVGNTSSIISRISEEAEGNAGSIRISANNLTFTNGGSIFANALGRGNAGSVEIIARDNIRFDGESSSATPTGIVNVVLRDAEGNSGDITITTTNLSFTNGARIDSSTEGIGDAGDINITATETITFNGENSQGVVSSAFAEVRNGAEGNAGDINITTTNLNFVNGGRLFARTRRSGKGDAGNVTINASDTIAFDGASLRSVGGFSLTSGIVSSVEEEAEGNAGNIDLTANNVIFTNGGRVNASTEGIGNAGTINIIANDTITFDGSSIEGSTSGATSTLSADATGNAGGLEITAREFNLTNGGNVLASAEGQGNAGTLEITADSLNLDGGEIIATTNFGEGGEIILDIEDNLVLRNNSNINAQAFEDADGGNIRIDSNFIIAFPNQSSGNGSDIIAIANRGNGGNINITAESLFGIEERPLNSDTNDIDASSRFSLDGNITINTPDVNPLQGVTELPTNVVESEQTTTQACNSDRNIAANNSLVLTGKGGLIPSPEAPLASGNVIINGEVDNLTSTIPQPIETSQGKIQPARGIKITESGEVILTSYRTNNSGGKSGGIAPQRIPDGSVNCGRV